MSTSNPAAFEDTFANLFGDGAPQKPVQRKPAVKAPVEAVETYTFPASAFTDNNPSWPSTVKMVRSERGLAIIEDPCYPYIWQVVHMATGRSIVRGDLFEMERALADLLASRVDWATIQNLTRDEVTSRYPFLFDLLKEYDSYQTGTYDLDKIITSKEQP